LFAHIFDCFLRAGAALREYRADAVFFSARGMDEEGALDTTDTQVAPARLMIRNAALRVFLLWLAVWVLMGEGVYVESLSLGLTDVTHFRRTAGFQTCLKTHAWPRTRNQA
jgi:hypothetical protein